MEEKEKKDITISLEELSESKPVECLGEVCCADTGPPSSVITLKIRGRPDDLRLGQPLIIETEKLLYYTLIMRLYYPSNELAERLANSPFTGLLPPPQIEGVRGKEFYGLADLGCLRILPSKSIEELEYQELMRQFDTIPPIFSIGRDASEEEFQIIYKTTEYSDPIGKLRGFNYDVPIDFKLLVEKPYGLFGRTGIGKSILNKILCLYILKHNVSQLLLFDMQGEYGLISRSDKTKGLAYYFQERIQIYFLGEIDKKNKVIDGSEQLIIYKDNILSGDIIASAQNLNEPSINTLILIENLLNDKILHYDNLIDAINNIKTAEVQEHRLNNLSLGALRNRIIPFERYNFLKKRGDSKREDSIEHMFKKLLEGKSIVIDFGKYGTNTHLYLFVANMITRRLYRMYSQREDETLPPLVVIVEEAHKFLKSQIIRHTIFDSIARETRKFQLTLAFVDQRPSQIDEEVYSQIANTFVMHMNDDKDIKRVIQTLPDSKKWGGIISGLQKRQCFARGDALAVASVVDVLNYKDEKLMKKLLGIKKPLSETLKTIEDSDLTSLGNNR
ncbi:MAG: ATP-binding protein [Promethearchaeota archaeon]|nr:MAG: ATP-binding protein [Candidatus Lokiarchaeota archaeon]